jgi:hypothetical protein
VRGALVTIATVALLAIGGYWALLFFAQRAVMFPRPLAAGGIAPASGDAERTWLSLPFGKVETWFLPATSGAGTPHPLFVFAHGNGELIDYWLREFDTLRGWGASVLLVEYPGYGRSEGAPSQATIAQALTAAYDQAAARPDVDPARIVGWGRSLGGGGVCALARERALAALVLESTFTSVRQIARRFGLPGFLVRDPFDNQSVVSDFTGPILLVHGERDEILPAHHARSLHAAARRAELHLLDCGHNDCPRPWAALRRFLDAHELLDVPAPQS